MEKHSVGDLATLSSLGIMVAHNTDALTCVVDEVRSYREPSGNFHYTGYVCKAPASETVYLVLERYVGTVKDTMLYYCDKGVPVSDAAPFVLTEDGQEFLSEYRTTIPDTNGVLQDILWTKKNHGTTFGVEYSDQDARGIKTVCEFQTSDFCGDNSHTFVDWTGDHTSGWIEFWVGAPVSEFEVKFSKPGVAY